MRCKRDMFIIFSLVMLLSAFSINPAFGARMSGEQENIETVRSAQSANLSAPSATSSAPAGNPGNTNDEKEKSLFNIDGQDMDIRMFIKFISERTGKNFVVDNAVKGTITIISPTKISEDEAYRVFESVLEVHGFATVAAGDIIKIVPAVEARTKNIDTIFKQEGVRSDDKLVTRIIPLKYASAEELKKLFAVFISKNSIIVSYEPTGMLIITDILSNINRIMEIIEAIDVPGTGEAISVLPLNNASAEVIANSLAAVFKTAGGAPGRPQSASQITIVPDKRTNTLIVLASEVDTFRVKELLALLDRKIPQGEGDVHVYYLQNANAEDLSKVLTAIPSKDAQAQQAGTAPLLSRDIQVVADKATNSLIITAKKEEYAVLEDVIRKLDIARKMVYIEALIMEVSMSKEYELGVEWMGGKPAGHLNDRPINVFTSSNSGANIMSGAMESAAKTGVLSMPSGLTMGVIGDSIKIGDVEFPSIGAVVRAYATDSDVQILSTPQVTTMDNEEAEIKVVDNIPFITRRDTTSNSDIAYSNYEFKDVGVILKITPQINQERFVRLAIEQEVSQVVSQDEKSGQPTTLKREAKTTVAIKDGQTVVIGGLIDETDNKTKYRVPVFGKIPLLGWLFKSQTNSLSKKNLYIFLTAHIIENPAEAQAVYEIKKGHIDAIKEGAVKLYQGKRKSKDDRLCDKGYERLKTGDIEEALEYFTKALEANPESPHALFQSGRIMQDQGNVETAVDFYERLIDTNSSERILESDNPLFVGRKLTDIAEDNLKDLAEHETDR